MDFETNQPTVHYGGFWIRFVAYFIDGIINNLIAILIGFVLGIISGFSMAASNIPADAVNMAFIKLGSFGLSLIASWLYFALFQSSKLQATPGKLLFNLIVVDEEYKRLSFARATGRFFATFLSTIIIFIGFIIAAFTKHKRALHDFVAGTYVIYK